MLVGATTSHKLQVVTSAAADIEVTGTSVAVSTADPPVFLGSVTVPIVVASITTAVATPGTAIITGAASTLKRCAELCLRNNHASVSCDITIERTDGTNTNTVIKCTLLPGEALVYNGSGTWIHYDTDGLIKQQGVQQELILAATTQTVMGAAATDQLKVFARKRAGYMHLKFIGPSGLDEVVQPKVSENGFSMYLPNNATTVGLNYGLAWTSGGTVSHPTPTTTAPAVLNQQKRTRWANVVTTTNQFLGLRTATAEKRYWRGNAAGLGGFKFHARWSIELFAAATTRWFVGLNDSNAGWAISDTLTGNGCGFWHDTTEAASVLNFVTRDGTTATKAAITLGSNLAAGRCYDCWIWSAPNGSSIGYALQDLATGNILVDTTTTTTIPTATAFLGQELGCSNGTANTTVTTVAIGVSGHSCASDL